MGFICAVCRKNLFAGSEVSLAPCGHISHHQCWVQRSNSLCPKCGRSFWRDYLKKVHLEEETEQSKAQTDREGTVVTEIQKLREEMNILRSAINGYRSPVGQDPCQDGMILKTEPTEIVDPLSTVIYNDLDWDSVENCNSKDRQKKLCKNAGLLAVSALPSSASCLLNRDVFCEKIADSMKKFIEVDNDGYDIHLSIRRSDKQLFRLDLDLSSSAIKEPQDSSVAKNQNFQLDLNLKMDEKSHALTYTE